MRLKLNRTLRAALIAAITTVGFTLTQTQAETIHGIDFDTQCTNPMHNIQNKSTTNFYSTDANYGNGNCATSWGGLAVLEGGGIKTNGGGSWTFNYLYIDSSLQFKRSTDSVPGQINWSSNSANDYFKISSQTGAWVDVNAAYGANTVVTSQMSNGTVYLNDKGSLTSALNNTNTVEATLLTSGYEGVAGYSLNQGTGVLTRTLMTGDFSSWQTPATGITLTNLQDLEADKLGYVADNTGLYVTYQLFTPTAIAWKGTAEHSNWSDAESWSAPLGDNPSVMFDGTAEIKTATVDVDSAVAAITVSASSTKHTFNLAHNLTTSSLDIAANSVLALEGTGIMTVTGTLSCKGMLEVASGATLKVTDAAQAKALMLGTSVLNNGTFDMGASVTINEGATTHMGGTLRIGSGITLTVGTGDGQNNNLTSFDAIVLDGGKIYWNSAGATGGNSSINNLSTTSNGGTFQIYDINTNPVVLGGTTRLAGDLNLQNPNWGDKLTISKLTGSGSLNASSTSSSDSLVLSISSIEDFTGGIMVANSKTTLNATMGSNVTLATLKIGAGTANMTGAVTTKALEGAGSVHVTGNLTLNVADTKSFTGTLTVGGQITKTGVGSQTISSTALHHTILAQEGTLVLNGNFSIDDIAERVIDTKYVDYNEQESQDGNGFQCNTGTITVYSGTGTVDLNGGNGHFTFAGRDVTSDVQNGQYSLSDAVDKSAVYVNNGTLAIANYKEAAGDALASVVMAADTTLTADAATGYALTLADGASATVNTTEATTITSLTGPGAGHTLTLGGTALLTIQGTDDFAGAVQVQSGANVYLGGTTSDATLSKISNAGSLSASFGSATARVNMADSTGTLEMRGGTLDYRSNLGTQTLKMGGGTLLLFGTKDGTVADNPDFSNKIIMDGDATIQVHGTSQHASVTVSGDVEGAGHTLTKADGNQVLAFTGSVTLGGLTTTSNDGDTIKFAAGVGSIGKIKTDGATTVQFSAKADTANEYTFDTFNMANSAAKLRWLVVDQDVTVKGTGADLGNQHNSTIASGWGVSGGGLRINGVLDLAGAISFDDNNNSKIEGSGLINTTGLNISNGNTTTIQGGVKINITSATGIYRRAGNASTINLADATLMATSVDWELKSSVNNVNLTNTATGTTFDVAADRTITIANVLKGEGKLVKTGEGTLVLSSNDTHTGGIDVQEGKLVVKGAIASDITMGANASIENQGAAPITLSDVDEQLKQIENTGAGEMVFKNASGLLSVETLTIGADSTVSFHNKAETPAEGTITVTDTLTAGGGTLLANLTLVGGSTLDVAGGGEMALTLGSTLTLDTATGLINLDDATIDALSLLGMGQKLTLVQALEDTTLAYGEDDYTGTWYGQMFNRTDALVGDFQVFATEQGFGLTKVSNTPEPTTGTLSLLALAALAARRRRK